MISEVHIMKLQQHPAVLPLYAAFLVDDQLWMVLPFVAGGSAQDILKRQNGGQVCIKATFCDQLIRHSLATAILISII